MYFFLKSILHNACPQPLLLTCSMWHSQRNSPLEQTMCRLGYAARHKTHSGTHTDAYSHCTPAESQSLLPIFSILHCMKHGHWQSTLNRLFLSSLMSRTQLEPSADTDYVSACVSFQGWFASLSAFMGLQHWWRLDHSWQTPKRCTRTHTRTETTTQEKLEKPLICSQAEQ